MWPSTLPALNFLGADSCLNWSMDQLACAVVQPLYVCLTCSWLYPVLLVLIIDVNYVHFHDLRVQLLTPRVCSHTEAVVRRSIVLSSLGIQCKWPDLRNTFVLAVACTAFFLRCARFRWPEQLRNNIHAQEESEKGCEYTSFQSSSL